MNSESPIKAIVCKEDGPAMNGVVALADANTDRLGFVPAEALKRGAGQGEILAALAPGNVVAGYVWYRVTRSTSEARIHHLCVAPEYRKSGVGQLLVDEVKAKTRHLQSIVLRCRRDYGDSCRFWRRVGFTSFDDRLGRGKDEAVLTCFRYDHHLPDLWTAHREHLAQTRTVAVLDANVFFDLVDEERSGHREALAIQADWVSDAAALWIADELHNEIDRNLDAEVRRRQHGLAHRLNSLRADDDTKQAALQKIKGILPPATSDADESDHRHLAAAVAGQADYFITRDDLLLEHGPEIAEAFCLNILSPLEFILSIDGLQRKEQYQPARLAGSGLTIKRVGAEEVDSLSQSFLNHGRGETKVQFSHRLHAVLSDPHTGEGYLVSKGTVPVALMLLARKRGHSVEVALLRVVDSRLATTLACHLLNKAVETAITDASPVTVVNDTHCSSHINSACEELAFVQAGNASVKFSITGIYSLDDAAREFATLTATHPGLTDPATEVASVVESCRASDCSEYQLGAVERLLWPIKLNDPRLPSFMVPIKSKWAKHLFDRRLAAEDLFSVDTFLSLRHEDVYYRSARPRVMTAPGRVLWYVGEDRNYTGTAHLRACSLVDEVVVGPAKKVFKTFSRLGVFSWHEVLDRAGGKPDDDIMAFRFSGTQMLPRPVPKNELLRVLEEHRNTEPELVTALRLRPGEFAQLYSMAFGVTPKGTL